MDPQFFGLDIHQHTLKDVEQKIKKHIHKPVQSKWQKHHSPTKLYRVKRFVTPRSFLSEKLKKRNRISKTTNRTLQIDIRFYL